jgi:hypothetical protein
MLVAYFAIGFIQNLNVPRTLRFLKSQSGYNSIGDFANFKHWFAMWGGYFWAPLAFAAVLIAFGFWRRVALPRTRTVVLGFGVAFGPMLLMAIQNVNAPHAHYLMPVMAAQLVLLLGLFARPLILSRGRQAAAVFVLTAVFFGYFKLTAGELNSLAESQRQCRPEAYEVFLKISALADAGKAVYVDPYVPTMDRTKGVRSTWKVDSDYIEREKFDVLVINRNMSDHYLQLTDAQRAYVANFNPDADATAKFYAIFQDQTAVNDPRLGAWKKTHSNACQWQIWER